MDAAISAPAHASSGGHASHIDEAHKLRFGMGFYVVTDAIFVLFLLVAYVWLRGYNVAGGFFPAGTKLPDAMMSDILTGLVVASAFFYYLAYAGIRRGSQGQLRVGLLIATLLVLAALIGQIRFQGHLPFVTTDGSFASIYLMLSSYHIYHLLIGLFLGLGVTHRAFRGRYAAGTPVGLQVIGYFWFWMALMPVVVAIMMFLLPPQG
jgi:heme/copper-type cytochrome/quinol oxidase subunit 3